MGQAFKYSVLAVAIGGLLLLATSIINSLYLTDVTGGLGSSVINFLNATSSVIRNVKGALNYVVGSAIPVNLAIWAILVLPLVSITLRVTSMVAHFINQ